MEWGCYPDWRDEIPMSRQAHLALIIAACLLAGLAVAGFLVLNDSGRFSSITVGHLAYGSAMIGLLALILGVKAAWLVAYVLFIIQGFRVHWGWGLANIFLFPLAGMVFFIRHRREAKIPMLIWVFGAALLLILLACATF